MFLSLSSLTHATFFLLSRGFFFIFDGQSSAKDQQAMRDSALIPRFFKNEAYVGFNKLFHQLKKFETQSSKDG